MEGKTILLKPKLRTYIKYKTRFRTEEFAKCLLRRKHRCILAQFRSGTLPLQIETVRWQNLPIPERLCLVCAEDAVENDFHFISVCKKHKDMRDKLSVGMYPLLLCQMKINLFIL